MSKFYFYSRDCRNNSNSLLYYSCPPGRVGHTVNLPISRNSHLRDMGIQSFILISSFFLLMPYGASIYFCTLCKNCYKMQTCTLIASIFDTNEERVTVGSRTKFAVNLRNIQGVMSIYPHKKRSNFCHGYRVNRV